MRAIVLVAATALSIGIGGSTAIAAPPAAGAAAILDAVHNGTAVTEARWYWHGHRHCWWGRWGHRHCRWW